MSLPLKAAPEALPEAVPEAQPQDPYVLEEQIGHLLRRAHQRATAVFQETMGEVGLTPTQYAALVKIGDVGEISQNHLGRLTAMDPATSQGVIRRLEGHGLIALRPDPADRRRTLLSLSPAGKRILDPAIARGRAVTRATLAPLDDDEQARLLSLLKKLI
jgi:DNA-binding MarR family transcriptional regulator